MYLWVILNTINGSASETFRSWFLMAFRRSIFLPYRLIRIKLVALLFFMKVSLKLTDNRPYTPLTTASGFFE